MNVQCVCPVALLFSEETNSNAPIHFISLAISLVSFLCFFSVSNYTKFFVALFRIQFSLSLLASALPLTVPCHFFMNNVVYFSFSSIRLYRYINVIVAYRRWWCGVYAARAASCTKRFLVYLFAAPFQYTHFRLVPLLLSFPRRLYFSRSFHIH